MKPTDVLSLPFEWGSALRERRVFHPDGVLLSGSVTRLAESGRGLPLVSGDVVARVSKAVGIPAALPDIAGLAWRMPTAEGGAWDLLLVSSSHGRLGLLGRVVLRPITSWRNAVFSTLAPFEYEGSAWWLRARIVTPFNGNGLALDAVASQVRATGLEIVLEQAEGTDPFTTLARVSLDEVTPPGDMSFDPVRNEAAGVRMLPGWLADLRRAAYRRSRQGRHAQ